MAERDPKQDQKAWVKDLGLLTVVVSDLLVFTGAGIGIGYLAWKKWNWPWWVLVLTTGAGLALAMVRIYQVSRRLE